MILVMDIGNTNIKLGVFDGNELIASLRLSSSNRKTSDEYYYNVKNMLDKNEDGSFKYFTWMTMDHSDTRVNFYVNGVNLDFSKYYMEGCDYIKNTQTYHIVKDLFSK